MIAIVCDDCDCADTIRIIDAMVGMDKVKYGLKLSDSDWLIIIFVKSP